MKILKKILFVFFILLPIPHSFADMVTFVQSTVTTDDTGSVPSGVHFNPDGTKMFVLSQNKTGVATYTQVSEFNLTTPFDISTSSYAGDGERCTLNSGNTTTGPVERVHGLQFSKNGMMMFVARGRSSAAVDTDLVFRFDLTSPFDISTCAFANQTTGLDDPEDDTLQTGSKAGSRASAKAKNYIRGFDISGDGKKLFVVYHGQSTADTRLLEYELATAFDLSSDISLVTNAGIDIADQTTNPKGIKLSPDGKRLWTVDHFAGTIDVSQFTLDVAYSTSSFTIDGSVSIESTNGQPSGITFSTSGLKMFVGRDDGAADRGIVEYDLVCPFNIITGKCPSITENSDRTGMAEAQIELAKRTINFSTNSALNRLKWIRRNKDKQNLSNQNVKLNFSNSMLSSLNSLPFSSFKKISTTKKNNDSNKNYFYWSEGSISLGRVGDTSIASTKKNNTNALTFGFDKFTDDYGLEGFAFRFGSDDVDIGSAGSNLDSNTYNITYYSTSPIKDDTKYLDKIFGIGEIRSDITTVLDGKRLTAERTGKQIYGTFKIKDEYKKDKLTLIPSGQFDFGHTLLRAYSETGKGAIKVEGQHIRTKNLRAAMALVEDLSNDKYTLKRHGKLEYVAELDRSSNFKYTYVGDSSVTFNDTLHTGALHNLNGEIGVDIIFPEHYSVFIIYERNHAFGTGYTDNLYIALGYLPHKDTEYAFSLNGSQNIISKFEVKKDINGFDLSFNLNDDLTNLGDTREAYIELNKVF